MGGIKKLLSFCFQRMSTMPSWSTRLPPPMHPSLEIWICSRQTQLWRKRNTWRRSSVGSVCCMLSDYPSGVSSLWKELLCSVAPQGQMNPVARFLLMNLQIATSSYWDKEYMGPKVRAMPLSSVILRFYGQWLASFPALDLLNMSRKSLQSSGMVFMLTRILEVVSE